MNYVDLKTGREYETKPESMAQIKGNRLVPKNDPVIVLRGKLDHAQAVVVAVQSWVAQLSGLGESSQTGTTDQPGESSQTGITSQTGTTDQPDAPGAAGTGPAAAPATAAAKAPATAPATPAGACNLLADLTEILTILRKVMTAEVMKTPCEVPAMLGLSPDTLREQSHNTKKYFGVKSMTLPDYSMGPVYAGLNLIRTEVREVELAAVTAFQDPESPDKSRREDIIQVLNRLSSAVYVMMCRYLQGEIYK